MKKKGLVDRAANPDDRRSTLVRLTAAGQRVTAAMFDGIIIQDQEYFSVLNDKERAPLTRLFKKLLRLPS